MVVVVSLASVLACGDSRGQNQPIDASSADADECSYVPSLNGCSPYTQEGCDCDEKCGELLISEAPYLRQTACMPLGTTEPGMPCTTGKPGQQTGFDDCTAGYACTQGICAEICHGAIESSCGSSPKTVFGEGEVCIVDIDERAPSIYNDYGQCVSACDPTSDTVIDAEVMNIDCGAGFFCDLTEDSTNASCARTREVVSDRTQNTEPLELSPGIYSKHGCAPGFTARLTERNAPDTGAPQCARFCTPLATYLDDGGMLVGQATGRDDKCNTEALEELGGTNGVMTPHQCRFLDELDEGFGQVPASLGICMPTVPSGGGTLRLENGATGPASWGNCELFAWEEIKASWNAAAPLGPAAKTAAFNEFCLENPLEPQSSGINEKCIGFFFGCVSQVMMAELL